MLDVAFFIVILNVVRLNVIMLDVTFFIVMLSVVMLNVVILLVILLSVLTSIEAEIYIYYLIGSLIEWANFEMQYIFGAVCIGI